MRILKNYRNLFCIVVTLILSLCIYANDSFSQGVVALGKKDWPKAEQHFQSVLQNNPNAVEAYYNLGLVKMRQNQLGWALGYFYKSLDLQPNFTPAKEGLEELKDKIAIEKFSGFWGSLRSQLLTQASYDFLWMVFLFVVFVTFIVWIRYFKKRQLAYQTEGSLPQVRGVHIAFSIFSILLFLILSLQTFDRRNAKAVTVVKDSAVFSAPFEESAQSPLFNLPEGALLEILKQQNDFYQVRSVQYGSGWIRKNQIYIFSEEI